MNDPGEHGDEYVEECDCRRCALEFRTRYKRALASISEEMGLPPSMGPRPGELKRLLEDGRAAMERIKNAPTATSRRADFELMTWTFEFNYDVRAGAGLYALVPVDDNNVHDSNNEW